MLIAFPNGRLEGRIDRWVVALLYVLFIGGWLLQAMTSPAVYNCDPFCGRNVFAVRPDEALHQVVLGTTSKAILILAIPVAIALWQHWRAATPAARRAFVPAILAIPVNAVIAVISTLAIAFGLDIGWVADHGFKSQLAASPPAALLVGLVQSRLERARAASLLVELGHGVPPAGLREALARAVRDPTLELAFPAPDGSRLMDPSGQPFRQPAAGADRAVARVERGGKLLAILVHDPAIDAEDQGLVEAVGSAAGLALENARLAAEVRPARGGQGIAGAFGPGRGRRATAGRAGPPRRGPAATRGTDDAARTGTQDGAGVGGADRRDHRRSCVTRSPRSVSWCAA